MEDMDRIGGPLKDLLARLRLSGPMVGWRAVELWPEVVGERVAARTRAVAFREGTLGIIDYYKLRNIQADTEMRSSIAKPAPTATRGGPAA